MHLRMLVLFFLSTFVVGQVDYTGRWFATADGLGIQYDWSAVAFTYTFTGSSISMVLQDSGNYYSVRVDGTVLANPVIADGRGNQTYPLASGLGSGSHTIQVLKRTEPFNGPIAIFKGFQVDNGALIVKPNAPKTGRRLEFWGDSITCGYGDLGKDYTCHYSADTEDETVAYGPVTARALNADVSVVAWSGKGVVRNYGDANPTSPDPMPIYLPSNTGNNLNNKYNWGWVPNAVVINLGTNDYSTNPTPSYDVFSSGYINMTNLVRNNYGKNVVIFTVCGPLINDPCCANVKNITATLNSQGDPNVHYVDMQNILSFPADYGCDYHPAVSGQQKMANVLIPVVKSVLGW